jgi:S-adenosylmethionine:diacylglycerol 3-amino-3-carboxypropyl transferase
MFERFKSARKLWNATTAATGVLPLVAPSLFPASVPGGGFDRKLASDKFVVGYVYGVLMACEGTGDQEEQGYFIQQVFERLFPNHGKEIAEFCTLQAVQKDPDFMGPTKIGFAEMMELVRSEGHKPLSSLLRHVSEYHSG